ncbi:thioredoxin family protein [Mariniphaga sediminis]|uniref:Thioredoxin family protein n=1 Tax=Mariniphaga sediminis TaxID=1628158 RepID=A0A399CYC4_9BACT|nr:thioredoxin family protein [Mariniphaga sediminis]RIH63070.1 thioredoxin family protein [Mariniphaga sediminis]
MVRKNFPVILLVILVIVLFLGYLLKDNLNGYISAKMREIAGDETILSGKEWVDSLFNYTKNKQNFEFSLLQFKSGGCTICKQMEPELEKIKNATTPRVNVVVLNVLNENSLNVMKYFGISVVPTHLILDKNGQEIFRKYGFISGEELLEKCR